MTPCLFVVLSVDGQGLRRAGQLHVQQARVVCAEEELLLRQTEARGGAPLTRPLPPLEVAHKPQQVILPSFVLVTETSAPQR